MVERGEREEETESKKKFRINSFNKHTGGLGNESKHVSNKLFIHIGCLVVAAAVKDTHTCTRESATLCCVF